MIGFVCSLKHPLMSFAVVTRVKMAVYRNDLSEARNFFSSYFFFYKTAKTNAKVEVRPSAPVISWFGGIHSSLQRKSVGAFCIISR